MTISLTGWEPVLVSVAVTVRHVRPQFSVSPMENWSRPVSVVGLDSSFVDVFLSVGCLLDWVVADGRSLGIVALEGGSDGGFGVSPVSDTVVVTSVCVPTVPVGVSSAPPPIPKQPAETTVIDTKTASSIRFDGASSWFNWSDVMIVALRKTLPPWGGTCRQIGTGHAIATL